MASNTTGERGHGVVAAVVLLFGPDGRRQIVQVTVRSAGAMLSWTKDFCQLDRATMTKIATTTGAQKINRSVWEEANGLVRPC